LEGEMLLARALELVVRAGGVGVEKLLWQYGENVFGFTRADGSDGGIFRGFGAGRFARMIEEGGG
jgi:hypothetical protein